MGCVELFGALVVAIGCAGELWLLINKLTLHIEPVTKSENWFWRSLAWADSTARPFLIRLKIKGRKLPEAKEQLLERLFVILVAFGVAIEFFALPFSMNEIAALNKEAGDARKDAGIAIEQRQSTPMNERPKTFYTSMPQFHAKPPKSKTAKLLKNQIS